jgi:hypothetical protein
MKSTRTAMLVAGCLLLGMATAFAQNVRVIQEVKHDVSMPLREMAKITPIQHNVVPRIIPLLRGPAGKPLVSNVPDPVAQQQYLPALPITQLLNFDGQGADNLAPPDTEGSVGATQYVQWVNVEYNVYDKTTGAKILGPVAGNAFWAGFGGACQTNNSGDPIVSYDKAAQRWFVAQNVFSAPYMACIAVSTTSDITGSFNRYAFSYGSTDFPDYPKWGVWSDAYYQSFNDFLNGFSLIGSQVCAADRAKMLAGGAATLQCILVRNQTGMLPSDLDGATAPPAGSPNYYVNLGNTTNAVNFWQFHVDFVNPTNTTFTGPTAVTVPSFSEICSNGTNRSCITQPSPGEGLDSLGDRMMYRAAYRNFGDHEAIVTAHTVKPGTGSTAVGATRWYEFRSPAAPTLFQSGTYQNSTISLWMPSIAMDKNGDIALGMSASSSTVDPSVVYAVRTPTITLGKLSGPQVVVKGTGVQQSTFNRWGDYSDMQIDPVDDCTFWYTQEYIKTTGSFNWSTRINSFKFNSCN